MFHVFSCLKMETIYYYKEGSVVHYYSKHEKSGTAVFLRENSLQEKGHELLKHPVHKKERAVLAIRVTPGGFLR